ncbi:MAG TPA: asparagine synthase C-terminal domain-containing protein, partial [Bryobacteraceae bacterium]|nr:asparagine synthase C-terminal domain-containing protein [Bryobacteraceae bacterium]
WAVAQSGSDITAFTVGASGDPLDESADARHTAQLLGIRHEVIDLSGEELPAIDDMVSAYGEPFACSSSLGMLRISRAVKNSATVLLTGDGGDDVFLGYPEHVHFAAAQRLAGMLPPGSDKLWAGLKHLLPHRGLTRRAVHFLDYATGGLGAVTRAHPGWNVYRDTGMMGPALLETRLPQREIPLALASARELLRDFLKYDRNNRFTGEYLTKIDGATMYYGLEGRSPFLDQELWSFVSSLPYSVRLHGGKSKAILRELARRKIGPRVAGGKKRGFAIPANRWLVTRWREQFESLLSSSKLHQAGWISAPAVLKQYRKALEAGVASNQLWYIFVLENWLRQESSQTSGPLSPAFSGSVGRQP